MKMTREIILFIIALWVCMTYTNTATAGAYDYVEPYAGNGRPASADISPSPMQETFSNSNRGISRGEHSGYRSASSWNENRNFSNRKNTGVTSFSGSNTPAAVPFNDESFISGPMRAWGDSSGEDGFEEEGTGTTDNPTAYNDSRVGGGLFAMFLMLTFYTLYKMRRRFADDRLQGNGKTLARRNEVPARSPAWDDTLF